jgi:hypothetical protein
MRLNREQIQFHNNVSSGCCFSIALDWIAVLQDSEAFRLVPELSDKISKWLGITTPDKAFGPSPFHSTKNGGGNNVRFLDTCWQWSYECAPGYFA